MLFPRWREDSRTQRERRRVGEGAAEGGQAAGQGVEAGGHPSRIKLESAGQHSGGGEGRDHAEAEDAGAVEEHEAAGRGHVATPVARPAGHGRPAQRGLPGPAR